MTQTLKATKTTLTIAKLLVSKDIKLQNKLKKILPLTYTKLTQNNTQQT
jgi:hypothetical protein